MPEAFIIRPIRFHYRKKAPPSGELSPKVTERVSAVENIEKLGFSTHRTGVLPVVENSDRDFSNLERAKAHRGMHCEKQRKILDFLFYKRQNARINPHVFPAKDRFLYGLYKRASFLWWKTRWKKWKTSLETPLLFHKNGGKPGGKSEKILRKGGFVTLFGCDGSGTGEICAVVYQHGNKVFPSPSFLECPAQSWYNTIDILQILSGRETA